MAAERPENAEERLVAEALYQAFGGPVPDAAFLAGREAVLASAAVAAEEAAADADLVGAALSGAFTAGVDADTRSGHIAAIRAAAAQPDNVIPLRRFGAHVGRHAVAAMVAVSTLAGGSGVAAASTDALPGEALYPVKRAVEQVMLTAAFTPGFEARIQTTLAARRLDEAEQLLAGGAASDVVAPLLTEYEQHVALVAELDVTSAAQVAVLEVKAEALREHATAETATALVEPQADDPAVTTTTPSETSAPTPTATEASTAAPESTATETAPQPAPSTGAGTTTTTTTTSEPTSSPSGSGGGSASTQPAPTSNQSPKPSPSPSPSPSSSPTATPKPTPKPTPEHTPDAGADVDRPKKQPPGQAKPKPNNPSPSPTADPDREPLPDGEETSEVGPLADWEEHATYTDAD